MEKIMYKAFDSDFKCRGSQYKVGETYTYEGNIKACSSGFHACVSPEDVLKYYPITSRFAEVVQSGNVNVKADKISSSIIYIKRELSLSEFIDLIVKSVSTSSGGYSRLTSSGEYSNLASSGHGSRVKGKNGNAIALVYVDSEGQARFVTGVIGEDGLKEDTWYKAEYGEFIEVIE